MDKDELDIENKVDLLKFIYQDQRGEMEYRREREYRIFVWSSGLLTALIGALLITKQSDVVVWQSYSAWGNVVASAAVILISAFSSLWHHRNRRFRGQNAKVIARISRLLHCYDTGYFDKSGTALFPPEWSQFGKNKNKSKFRRLLNYISAINYTSATLLLGALALMMIWLG